MAQGVSEYIRGFSFMPEHKVDVIDFQYIEGGELSRAWKISRRERLKNVEDKIWDEFINERDIVDSVSSDNPYQFIDELPEDCVRETLEKELTKMKEEVTEEVPVVLAEPKKQDYPKQDEQVQDPRENMVTFADSEDECDVIRLGDDDEGSVEGGEQENVNTSMESPPLTVREKASSDLDPEMATKVEKVPTSREKSPENVTNMIETSIYSAKVKELQSKVNLELLAVITTLQAHNPHQLDPNKVERLTRQCSEFCARYSRVYVYPMSRQIHDITRHNNSATPYARHTHTRSQLIRTVSLQQSMLQSLQIFHKWFTQKTPLKDCVYALKNFIELIREADSVCPADVHNEELLQTCENLEVMLRLYLVKLKDFLGENENATSTTVSRSVKCSKSSKKRSFAPMKKQSKTKPEADAKLSMYSLDRLPRHSISKSSGGTSKARIGVGDVATSTEATERTEAPAKNSASIPTSQRRRVRRPLMRAPGGSKRRIIQEQDNIKTLVETVDNVASPRGSANVSVRGAAPPPHSPRRRTPRTPRTPRSQHSPHSPRPRTPHSQHSPHSPSRRTPRRSAEPRSPRAPRRGVCKNKDTTPNLSPIISPKAKKALSDKELQLALDAVHASEDSVPSVITMQCAKKDSPAARTPKTTPRTAAKLNDTKGRKEDKDVSSSDVSVLLKKLCAAGQSNKTRGLKERVSGSKNAQLLCINGGSPRAASLGTPQLLRILEETIQKQAPKPQFGAQPSVKDLDRYRLSFCGIGTPADALFQYRTKFVQHMLSSPMYANSAVGKPWEMIGKISEQLIDEMLLSCAKEMQLNEIVEELYKSETQ